MEAGRRTEEREVLRNRGSFLRESRDGYKIISPPVGSSHNNPNTGKQMATDTQNKLKC